MLNFHCVVVDFSDSQRNGFISAVRKLWHKNCSTPFNESHRQQFLANLKGCLFHYKQSVKNVKNNGNVVNSSMTTLFQTISDRLYDAATTIEFERAATDLLARFPKAKTWLNWWTQPGHRLMIFKAYRNEELQEEFAAFYNMPTTNNVVESNNRNTNRFLSYKEMPVVIAAHDVFKFCRLELNQLHGIRTGAVVVHRREGVRRDIMTARSQEWTEGRRAPTSTTELLSVSSAFSSAPKRTKLATQISSQSADETVSSAAVLRDVLGEIHLHGLPTGRVVECRNDTNDDKWLRYFARHTAHVTRHTSRTGTCKS